MQSLGKFGSSVSVLQTTSARYRLQLPCIHCSTAKTERTPSHLRSLVALSQTPWCTGLFILTILLLSEVELQSPKFCHTGLLLSNKTSFS